MSPIDPADAPSELDLARFNLLDSILVAIPGVEIGADAVAYGGLAAEGSGRAVWQRRPGSVEKRLEREIRALDIDWGAEREEKSVKKRKAPSRKTSDRAKGSPLRSVCGSHGRRMSVPRPGLEGVGVPGRKSEA